MPEKPKLLTREEWERAKLYKHGLAPVVFRGLDLDCWFATIDALFEYRERTKRMIAQMLDTGPAGSSYGPEIEAFAWTPTLTDSNGIHRSWRIVTASDIAAELGLE